MQAPTSYRHKVARDTSITCETNKRKRYRPCRCRMLRIKSHRRRLTRPSNRRLQRGDQSAQAAPQRAAVHNSARRHRAQSQQLPMQQPSQPYVVAGQPSPSAMPRDAIDPNAPRPPNPRMSNAVNICRRACCPRSAPIPVAICIALPLDGARRGSMGAVHHRMQCESRKRTKAAEGGRRPIGPSAWPACWHVTKGFWLRLCLHARSWYHHGIGIGDPRLPCILPCAARCRPFGRPFPCRHSPRLLSQKWTRTGGIQ